MSERRPMRARVLCAAALALASARSADATHFRYGALFWSPDLDDAANKARINSPTFINAMRTNPEFNDLPWKVQFRASFTFRRDYFWGAYFKEQWREGSPTGGVTMWKGVPVGETIENDFDCVAEGQKPIGQQRVLCFENRNASYIGRDQNNLALLYQPATYTQTEGEQRSRIYNYQLKFPTGFHFSGRDLVPENAPKVCKSYLHKGVVGEPDLPTCEYPNAPENANLANAPAGTACIPEFDGTAASWASKRPETDPPYLLGQPPPLNGVGGINAISVCSPWNEVFGFFFGDEIRASELNSHELELDVISIDFEKSMAGNTIGVQTPLMKPLRHTYRGNGPNGNGFLAFFTGGNRVSELNNNRDGRYRLETRVKFDWLRPENKSPVGTNLPVLPLPYDSAGLPVNFQIAAYDPDPHDQVRYFLGNIEELGALQANAYYDIVAFDDAFGDPQRYLRPVFTWYADYYHSTGCIQGKMDPNVCDELLNPEVDPLTNTRSQRFPRYSQEAQEQVSRWDPLVNYQHQPKDVDGNTIELDARTGIATFKIGKVTSNSPDPFQAAVQPGFYNMVVMIEEVHAEPSVGEYGFSGSPARTVSNDELYGPADAVTGQRPNADMQRDNARVKVPLDFLLFVYPPVGLCSGDCGGREAGVAAPLLSTFESQSGYYGDPRNGARNFTFGDPAAGLSPFNPNRVPREFNPPAFTDLDADGNLGFTGECKICAGGGDSNMQGLFLGATVNANPVMNYDRGQGFDLQGSTYCQVPAGAVEMTAANGFDPAEPGAFAVFGREECKGARGAAPTSIVPLASTCKPNHRPYFLTQETYPKGPTPLQGLNDGCYIRNADGLITSVKPECRECRAIDSRSMIAAAYGMPERFTSDVCRVGGRPGNMAAPTEAELLEQQRSPGGVYQGAFVPGVVNCVRNEDCKFELVAYDADDCVELFIGTTGLFDTMYLSAHQRWNGREEKGEQGSIGAVFDGVDEEVLRRTVKRKFIWPTRKCIGNTPSEQCVRDDDPVAGRPDQTLVCFYASDKYLVTVFPYHCLRIFIRPKGDLRWCDEDAGVGTQTNLVGAPNQLYRTSLEKETCIPLCVTTRPVNALEGDGVLRIRKVEYERPGGDRDGAFVGWPHPDVPYAGYGGTFEFPYDEVNFPPAASTRSVRITDTSDPLNERFCFTPRVGEECAYTVCFQGVDDSTAVESDLKEEFLALTNVRCFKIEVVNYVMEFDGAEQAEDAQLSKYVVPMLGMTMSAWAYPQCAGLAAATNMTIAAFGSLRDIAWGSLRGEAPATSNHKGFDAGLQVRNALMFNVADPATGIGSFFYYDHDAGDVFSRRQYACDKWHFVAVAIAEDDSAVLYVDGVMPAHVPKGYTRDVALFDAVPFSTTSRPDNNMDGDDKGRFHVGHLHPFAPGAGFVGYIDDVAVFNRALSALEVEGHRLARVVGGSYAAAAADPALVGYYTARTDDGFRVQPVTSDSGEVLPQTGTPTALVASVGTPSVVAKAIPSVTPCVLGIQHAVGPVDGDCATDVYVWNMADGVAGACAFGDVTTRASYVTENIATCTTPAWTSPRFVTVRASNDGGQTLSNTTLVGKTVRHLLMESALHIDGRGGGAAADSVCEDLAGRGFTMTAWTCPRCGPPAPPNAPPTPSPPSPPPPLLGTR